ncbi:hypothetical protein [Pinirhizobacter sp.]|jgi:hypothetical protein|uniref:hypothetical protein n=1 Tax=Pinirhizobacter sp. TaxID=2950432 RepID=UPI002F4156BC
MPKSLVVLFALLLASPFAWATDRQQDSKADVIELEPYLGVLWSFHARLGDHEGLFLLDTAGGLTVLTPKAATMAGCKPWGTLTGFRMRGDRIDLPRCDNVKLSVSHLQLHAPVAGIWDLMAKVPPGSPELMGSVALDSFAGRVVTLDLAHRQLIIESPRSLAQRVTHAREVSVHYSREIEGMALTPFVGVKGRSGTLWMELDSGSDGGAVINRHIAGELGLDPSIKGGQDVSTTLNGGVALKTRAHVDDLIYDGNIGIPTLCRWIVTFDLKAGRLWIEE